MQNQTLTSDHEIRQQLLKRYRIRLSMVYRFPSPYYSKIIYEVSELKQTIAKLDKITK